MKLAGSKTIAAMTPAERAKVAANGTAHDLVRLEKSSGAPVSEAVRELAVNSSREEFRNATGTSRGILVQTWIADPEAGRQMQRLVKILAGASADALRALADLLEQPETTAYAGGPTNRVDFLLGVMATGGAQEIATAANAPQTGDPDGVSPEVSERVLREQDYRCARCGERKPLQVHHIVFKSHGGTDDRENLEGRCAACHDAIHGRVDRAEERERASWVQ